MSVISLNLVKIMGHASIATVLITVNVQRAGRVKIVTKVIFKTIFCNE